MSEVVSKVENNSFFAGIPSFNRLPWTKELEGVDYAIVGIPFDLGVTNRAGTRFGPRHIRNFPCIPKNYDEEIDVVFSDYAKGVDYGDLELKPCYINESFDAITTQMKKILDSNVIPIVLGGDHSISYPELRAYKEKYGKLAMIHFDSHTDTWANSMGDEYYHHGTPFRNAIEDGCIDPTHSIQIGMRGMLSGENDHDYALGHGMEIITANELHKIGIQEAAKRIRAKVGNMPVFVTFDIDFLDPAFAPATGTPEVGGFSTYQAKKLVQLALVGLDIKGFDLVEVLQTHDPGHITGQAAGAIITKFIAVIADNKRRMK